jgi:mannose-6-phosphate isomerase-like protein (cupin superfamily)
MNTYPYTIENGAGERITFTGIVRHPAGERIEGEAVAQPQAGPPMHIHYFETEGFTVKSGKLGYQRLGEEPRYAGPGESVVFPAGVAHRWFNPGPAEVHFTGWAQPPNNHEYILAAIFGSMKRTGKRRPSLFDMAYLLTRYRAELGQPTIPILIQRILFPSLVAIGKLTRRYDHFKDAPEPIRHRRTMTAPAG